MVPRYAPLGGREKRKRGATGLQPPWPGVRRDMTTLTSGVGHRWATVVKRPENSPLNERFGYHPGVQPNEPKMRLDVSAHRPPCLNGGDLGQSFTF